MLLYDVAAEQNNYGELILFCVRISSADVCINEGQFFLHGPTSELLVCNLKLTANVSSSMKQLAEQEWGIHSSQITLTHEGKKIRDDQNASL